MNTMNDQDGDTKHSYDQYANEVLQLEWEQAEALRQVQHIRAEHTSANAPVTVADDGLAVSVGGVKPLGRAEWTRTGVGDEVICVRLCWRCDREAEYAGYCEAHYCQHVEEQSEDNLQEWDEWLEDAYSAEELQRLSALEQERRDDH